VIQTKIQGEGKVQNIIWKVERGGLTPCHKALHHLEQWNWSIFQTYLLKKGPQQNTIHHLSKPKQFHLTTSHLKKTNLNMVLFSFLTTNCTASALVVSLHLWDSTLPSSIYSSCQPCPQSFL
jgi:hypothetical protein